MKKTLFLLISLTAATYAQEPIKIKVISDRVSLRAVPDTNAVLLGRAMTGDELIMKDNRNPDWVGVFPPETVDLWVSGEFVAGNSVVPETLNIRSGPSLSHSVVGSEAKGASLIVRGEAGGWLKVAPTSNSVIWVSRKYVEAPAPSVIEPVEAPVSVQPTQTVVQVVADPTVQEIMASVSAGAEKPLIPDPDKPQGTEGVYSGVLQPATGTLYKLIDEHFTDVIVCYVKGNAAQMQTFTGMKLEISGKVYWAKGMENLPLIRPARIKLFATPAPQTK
jgi:hypothetical protein